MILDLGDFNNSRGVLIPGQSGNPSSPHYDDQIDNWFKNEYHPIIYNIEEVENNAINLLHLNPQK
jgi:penicillin amidase